MKNLTFLVLSFLFSTSLSASGIEGYVRNQAGEPLIGATVFITSTGQGAVTNADGYYLLKVPTGEQKVVFQYLGYKSQTKNITIPNSGRLKLNITLAEQSLRLPELEISGSDKELANAIMRKAIAKANYHTLQIDKYTTTVYIKGAGRLKKSPKLLRKTIEKEGIDSSMAFTSESISEITYERPKKYHQRVISIFEQGNSNNTSPGQFLKASFYDDNVAGDKVSPLSRKAFAYYKFSLEGYFIDRDYGVNKIKVTPRNRGENVFEGYIYILEDLWSIHSLDLTFYSFGIKGDISQIYAPVKNEVWMPITQKFTFNGKFFGFAFEYIYNAISSNYIIEINPDLDTSFGVVDNKGELTTQVDAAEVQEPNSTLDKLNSGKELTRKDLRKIIKKYEKEERKKKVDKEVLYEETLIIDSLARKKDSTYWVNIRPIPLTKYEEKGYRVTDSLNLVMEEQAKKEELTGKKTKSRKNRLGILDIFTGTHRKIKKNSAFYTDGILKKSSFNPVEGYSLREKFSFSHSANGKRQSIYISPRYAFARRELFLTGGIDYNITTGSDIKTDIGLEGGNSLFQYNESGAILEILNAFENLFSEKNYIRLFQKKYAKINYSRTSVEWTFSSSLEWAKRNTVYNTTTQTFWNRDDRDYSSNIPTNEEVTLPLSPQQNAAIFSLSIEGQPWLKYKIKNGKKTPISGTSPIIGLQYKKGIKNIMNSEVDYDFVEATFKQTFKVRAGTNLKLNINAGIFLNKKSLGFTDFKHFKGNQLAITDIDPVNSFRLMKYYKYSTQDKFLSVNAQYQFRKFLFTQIPKVWLFGIKENLFVNSLSTPFSNNYWEAGYSIENIFRIFRVEVAASFEGNKYRDWGIFIGVSSVFNSDGSGITLKL